MRLLKDNDRITSWQTTVILVGVINATAVLKMPRVLGEQVGPDGWASLIVGHTAALLVIMVMITLGRRFIGATFIEYSQQIVGRIPGSLLGLTAIVFWVAIAARILRVFSDIIKLYVLPRTPVELIITTMLLLSMYLARHGLEPIARVMEILFGVIVLVVGALVLLSIPSTDLTNLQPVLHSDLRTILLTGVNPVIIHLQGIEIFLMLLPFMLVPETSLKVASVGIGINLVIQLSLFIVAFGTFGEHAIDLAWPVANLAQYAAIPGGVVEHLEIAFLLMWITMAFSSIIIYSYLACLGLSRLLGLGEQSILTFPLLPIIYFIALIPANVFTVEKLEAVEEVLHAAVAWAFPPLLLLIGWIRGLSGQGGAGGGK